MNPHIKSNFAIALESVVSNKLRSFLTTLGVIFGVAAVIAMLAIGNGAKEEILHQIKLVGVNNIVVKPIINLPGEDKEDNKASQFSTGLTLQDAISIKKIIPQIKFVSPEILLESKVIYNGQQLPTKLVGVENQYFESINFEVAEGNQFSKTHLNTGASVCIIGNVLKNKLFHNKKALGKRVKVGQNWLTIVGILEKKNITNKSIENLGIRDYNEDIYTPIKTVLLRYENRANITETLIQRSDSEDGDENTTDELKDINYHQLDRMVIQVEQSEYLKSTAIIVGRLLSRKHHDTVDFEISLPELLLQQQQKTKNILNVVLGSIAAISLLVGGIGIMNIMLASVMERIKEIGLRLAIGAKKKDIVYQFVLESTLISVSGGILGIFLGIAMAYIISLSSEITTIVSWSSVIVSFGVSALVGLFFGISPARRAANQNPIESLRHE
jgi:putative ABC transport system permease protein